MNKWMALVCYFQKLPAFLYQFPLFLQFGLLLPERMSFRRKMKQLFLDSVQGFLVMKFPQINLRQAVKRTCVCLRLVVNFVSALPNRYPKSTPNPSYLFCVPLCNLCLFRLVSVTFLQDSLWLLELLLPERTEIRIAWLFTIHTNLQIGATQRQGGTNSGL